MNKKEVSQRLAIYSIFLSFSSSLRIMASTSINIDCEGISKLNSAQLKALALLNQQNRDADLRKFQAEEDTKRLKLLHSSNNEATRDEVTELRDEVTKLRDEVTKLRAEAERRARTQNQPVGGGAPDGFQFNFAPNP